MLEVDLIILSSWHSITTFFESQQTGWIQMITLVANTLRCNAFEHDNMKMMQIAICIIS